MTDLHFVSPDKLFEVNLRQELYSQMQQYCIKSYPRETGGIIIGNYSNDLKMANINKALGPPQKSIHQRSRFIRSGIGIKQILDFEWEMGNYYLGEWHYHPNASPTPSYPDIKQMMLFSHDKSLNCPEPILLIIGGTKERWLLSAHIICNKVVHTLHHCNV